MNSLLISFTFFILFSKSIKVFLHNSNTDVLNNSENIRKSINVEKYETTRMKDTGDVHFRYNQRNFQFFLNENHSDISSTSKTNEIFNLRNNTSLIYKEMKEKERSNTNGNAHKNLSIERIRSKISSNIHNNLTSNHLQENTKKLLFYKVNKLQKCEFIAGKQVCKKTGMDNIHIKKRNPLNIIQTPAILQEETKQWSCSLQLIADHTFVKHMNGNKTKIKAEMFYHMKKIHKFYSVQHDILPKGIGFIVENVTIYDDKNHADYPLKSDNLSFPEYIRILHTIEQTWCLVIVFCHREFKGRMSKIHLGGICEHSSRGEQHHHPHSKDQENFNFNVGFVTTLTKGEILSRKMVTLNLIHEIGHAFGAVHDDQENVLCTPGDYGSDLGNFIMSPFPLDGNYYNNWKFSTCSKKNIQETIEKKPGCLKIVSPKCGNGITETGEECDCGPNEFCKSLDPCCNPSGTPNECELKSGSICSPREAECCNENCMIKQKNESLICFLDIPCREYKASCDGVSEFCPKIPLPDGSLCSPSAYSSTCEFGECKSNVCKQNGLELCDCPIEKECHVCCMNSIKECRTSADLNFLQSNNEIFAKIPGTECQNTGICLSNGICSNSERRIDTNLNFEWLDTFWPYILPLPLLLLIFLTGHVVNEFYPFSDKKDAVKTQEDKKEKKKKKKKKKVTSSIEEDKNIEDGDDV